jgi:hypothetical protein
LKVRPEKRKAKAKRPLQYLQIPEALLDFTLSL